MVLPVIDFKSFTPDDILECLQNGDVFIDNRDFDIARDGAFKYVGKEAYRYINPRYLVGFVNDDGRIDNFGDLKYYVKRVFVTLGDDGFFIANFAPYNEVEGTREEIDSYIERTNL